MSNKKLLPAASIFLLLTLLTSTSYADNSWGNYHWARQANPFALTIVNSTTADWDGYVGAAVADWSTSTVLSFVETDSSTSSRVRRRCKPPTGQIRICNLSYGQNGWLGLAGITIDSNSHITSGYTKLNDSYFSSGFYNDPAWKQSVTCQELGHDFGLGHQDENFNNDSLFSCMDYQNPPFPSPNNHDFGQLETIYATTDSYDSFVTDTGGDGGGGGGGGCNAPPGKGCNKSDVGNNNGDNGWGMSLGRRGQSETFIRIDRQGIRHITHVYWAIGF